VNAKDCGMTQREGSCARGGPAWLSRRAIDVSLSVIKRIKFPPLVLLRLN
jgi:hypothetical protein